MVKSAEETDSAESVSIEEIEAVFEKLELSNPSQHLPYLSLEGNEIEVKDHHDLQELETVVKGVAPQIYEENIHMHLNTSRIMRNWSVEEHMSEGGL